MTAIAHPRIDHAPAVASLLSQDGEQARLERSFVPFRAALLDPSTPAIDEVVTPDARCHELEAAGFPPGPQGFELFRRVLVRGLT